MIQVYLFLIHPHPLFIVTVQLNMELYQSQEQFQYGVWFFQYNHEFLFCITGGSLEVSRSFIDHSESFSTMNTVSISNNNSLTYRITNQLQFFDSLHCDADIPLPHRTFEATIRRTNDETLRK